MISAVLLDGQNNQVRMVKQVSNMFIADKAFEHATGSISLSIRDRKLVSKLFEARTVFIFGEGMNRSFVVQKPTMDNTNVFPSLTYELNGIEYLFNQRSEEDRTILWENLSPIQVCADLMQRIQNGSEIRRFDQLANEVSILGELPAQEAFQMEGGNVWSYIQDNMKAYEFCCDSLTTRLGSAVIQLRVPTDHKDIVISEISKHTKLNYVNLDFSNVVTCSTVGGEGEGIRRKYARFDSGETGIDRFEAYEDESGMSSTDGYISNDDYNAMLTASAESKMSPRKLETDYIVPVSLFHRVKPADTVYTSSSAVNYGRLEPKMISEMKTEVTNGVIHRSMTFA